MAFAPAELDGMLPAAKAGGKPVVRKSFVLSGYDVSDPREAPTPSAGAKAISRRDSS